MQMNWYGQSCFLIKGKTQEDLEGKSSAANVLIDPFDKKIGLNPPKIKPEIVLITHEHYDHNNKQSVGPETILIKGAGEYEIKGITIKGIPSWHDEKNGQERGANTIYVISIENIKITHLGDFGEKELSSSQLKEIGETDILLLPVGGIYTIDAEKAAHILHQIEPRIVIPMHYYLPKLNIKLNKVDDFIKASGLEANKENKLIIKRKDLPQEDDTKLYILKTGSEEIQ